MKPFNAHTRNFYCSAISRFPFLAEISSAVLKSLNEILERTKALGA